ncbi:MAG: hypothetical protein WAV46_00775 [Candidatus Moraniibacteriota bacterium]
MTIPLWSIVTLVAEIGVTAAVFHIIWKGVAEVRFNRPLAFGVLAYEVLFNISYMLGRTLEHANEKPVVAEKSGVAALAIFHGVFSLVMFVALVAFFLVAANRYAKGENFFLHHHRLTSVFLSAWGVSVLSGVFFFVRLYL